MGRLLPILFLLQIALCVAALISCLSTEEGDIKGLPRFAWVIIILLFPLVGSLAWFIAGKERYSTPRRQAWRPGGGFPESDRPRRTVAPDDDPEFLKRIDTGRAEQEAARRAEEERELLRKWEEDLRRREDELREKDKPED
ncbi:PLD nuclease N-terminal domain-containing protein [Allorhizocola rhizosphaerae]|uniref:PLD nuclease N-terminal domain-containing protein n=1 Tax=Allorhizocola rhizosphaerae TaxID=1872709 RepID=UPI000E3C2E72|nr:PLD nuclease N-terminal domain-containing protein [Allorhizocola rhizosphaerae]